MLNSHFVIFSHGSSTSTQNTECFSCVSDSRSCHGDIVLRTFHICRSDSTQIYRFEWIIPDKVRNFVCPFVVTILTGGWIADDPGSVLKEASELVTREAYRGVHTLVIELSIVGEWIGRSSMHPPSVRRLCEKIIEEIVFKCEFRNIVYR